MAKAPDLWSSTRTDPVVSADMSADPPPDTADLRAVHWYLLLAIESHALGQTQRAQEALDAAFGILADLDEHDALVDTAQARHARIGY